MSGETDLLCFLWARFFIISLQALPDVSGIWLIFLTELKPPWFYCVEGCQELKIQQMYGPNHHQKLTDVTKKDVLPADTEEYIPADT